MASIDGTALVKPLVAKGDTVGVKISLGYKRNSWDLKYAIFLSSVSTVRVTQGNQFITTMNMDQSISLAAMSFTVGYSF